MRRAVGGQAMAQLWMIERHIAGWTDDELEAGGIRAKICALWFPNLEWVRSFHDREGARTICIYRADTEADIRRHALASGLPCNSVMPVGEVLPTDLDEGTYEDVAALEAAVRASTSP